MGENLENDEHEGFLHGSAKDVYVYNHSYYDLWLQSGSITVSKNVYVFTMILSLYDLPTIIQPAACNRVINAGGISSIKLPILGSKGGYSGRH